MTTLAPLIEGDTIGIMSPSSYITKADLDKAASIVKGYGYNLHIHKQTVFKINQSAGTNNDKLNAFHDLIVDPNIKAILFSSGGNRALHWADNINYDLVKANPKIIMGFSDVTSILNLITANTGVKTFHGPNLRWFLTHENNHSDIEQCFRTLSNPTKLFQYEKFEGPFIGGNASIIQYLTNDLDFADKILFLEDWNIEYSHLDLIFKHLNRAGVFDNIRGLLLGQFDNLKDTGRPYGFTLDDIIKEHTPKQLPIIKNAAFGHGDRLITIPIEFYF